MSAALKPCPFCGHPKARLYALHRDWSRCRAWLVKLCEMTDTTTPRHWEVRDELPVLP